jgi:hypothetical protein
MTTPQLPTGLRLSALPPVYEFTQPGYAIAWSCAGVFLFDYHGRPHWFATDGYSAMLTPALLERPEHNEALFSVSIGSHRAYRQDHVKNLFKYAKHGHVLYDPANGNLISPDGIMIVPPFEHQAEEGETPEPVTMPDVQTPFQGEEVEQSSFQFGLKFVSAIRSAFRANCKDAELTLICLEGDRARLEVAAPYEGQVLIAMSNGAPIRQPEPKTALDALQDSLQHLTDGMPGLDSITISLPGRPDIELKAKDAQPSEDDEDDQDTPF